MADGCRKLFSTFGFIYTMNVSYNVSFSCMKIVLFFLRKTKPKKFDKNPCGISCGMIACSDVPEANKRQKTASRMAKGKYLLDFSVKR